MTRSIARFCIAACLAGLAGCGTESENPVRNLVLVCIDTVRFDTFFLPEQAGIEDELSPRLQEAIVHTRAHATAPWTVPSVVSVFTGLYPAQHGAGRFNKPVANLNEDVPSRLPEAAVTLAEHLKNAGFGTGAFVAHPWFRSGYGMEQGFDALHLRKGSDKVIATGLKWLDVENVEPFFLYLHLMEAHDKHLKVDRLDEFLEGADPALLEAARERAPGGICESPDNLMCRRYLVYAKKTMDERRALAGLLAELEQRELLAETAVMVYSDHGEEFHDHLEAAQALGVDPRGMYGFGHGQSLYQELLHVPLIAWHPGRPGQTVDDVISLVDVTPTLLDWAGAGSGKTEFAGRVMPAAEQGPAPFEWTVYDPGRWPDMDRHVFASGIAYGPEQIAVLEDGWKYVWHEATGESNLYNLRDDPGETRPVEARVVDSMEPAMDQYFRWFTNQRFDAPTLTDEQVRQLKGVGYLQGRESAGDESSEREGEGDG